MAPRLSVIVPIYNVERYLPACLDSLAAQTFRDIEVLMVDDGSPDNSAAIAAEYEARDKRFKLIRKENAGLGAARNTGIAHMSDESEFLTFVDSDDVIPPDAYRLMIASLDESGSDFVTGNVFHLKGERSWQVPLMKMLAGEARKRTHISKYPKLIADRIACNKVFRRSFWEKEGFAFPEGILHEDIPVILPAHYRAQAIDIIGEPTYFWRLREGEAAPSITQRRKEPQAIRDRVTAVSMVSDYLAQQPGPEFAEYKRQYDDRVLRDDLRLFLRVLPDATAEFHEAFLEATNRYLDMVDPKIVMDLPTDLRVQWILVRKHAIQELIALLASQRRKEPIEVSGTFRKYASFRTLEESGYELPKAALRIDGDLDLRAPLRSVTWKDGKLVLSGDAWIDKIEVASKRSSVKILQLKRNGSRRRMFLPAKNVYRPECTTDSGQQRYNYDWAGWEVTLDPAKLRKGGVWQEGLWHVGINVYASGLVRRGGVWARGGSPANFPPYQWLDEDHRLLPIAEHSALKLRVEKVRALITDRRLDGDAVEISGDIRVPLKDGETLAFRLLNSKSGEIRKYPVEVTRQGGRTTFRTRVPLADVALLGNSAVDEQAQPKRRLWSTALLATAPDGTERQFSSVVREGLEDLSFDLPDSFGEAGAHREIAVVSGTNGYLKIIGRTRRAVLTGVEVKDGKIVVSGRSSRALVGADLILKATGRFDERKAPITWSEDGTFTAAFDPSRMGGSGQVPLKAGRWNLVLRSSDAEAPDASFVIDRLALPQFPLHTELNERRYWFENRWGDFPQLNCRSELSDLERGPYRQLQLRREVYEPCRRQPLRDQVFFLSYNGKQYSDSPRAMHEELLRRGSDLKFLWAVRDGQVILPPSAEKVRMWGREWFEALATSRYIVTNGHLPEWVERRPGQVIVQTWHGTMLKKIGHDIETLHFDREYQNRLALEAKNWSLLVSSNRFSTPILKRAFSYDGEILEAGYPRNDYLYSPDRDKIAEKVRKSLGIPSGKKVLLYAPTWRDDQSHSAGQYLFDLRIDLEDARRRLGEDHVLLIRRHSNIVDAVPGAGNGFVWDVSEYPDIADLYLLADVLITDYSSVMFDYAHLKRPMLFFTYDLEHYRDTLRGFYFDFEKDSPGPLLFTSEELVTAILNIDKVTAEYKERFERFHHLFCDLDDGHASRRVVDRMLEQAKEV
ncbi:glycosyl transferase family A [Streptomyces sp. F-3]|uniref:bifunctional glycosyltransferase/CDP-glycerol:glycerophosphate glycerophosphotransferase n=1 Tax=Streptomyces TaxID=1883 RepID=UPI0007C255DC|nr:MULTISPECIES: bifunctional glycosyltransferase family 2 protein/CDP-glycerol:glycerophosphate glycerophosphotransferase [Streptomyces]MDN5385238.1 bifunctional glycosyltransferase family 2 protein/CDP-glycerol:glycerophosphate glycerophosphotransferase [Streptomyces sp. LB8]GAT80292.1 glycosyl transferase family A [Streptomyces sp. F-3]